MKKIFRFIIINSIIMFLFFITSYKVYANTIKSIDMDIYLDANGNAFVTEIWNANLDSGTEGYKKYTNLGNSYITDFKVSDDSGSIYEYVNNWDINASFDMKKNKNGINIITNGVELCWGITNYGEKTYTISYNINNFVTEFTDAQGIYFNLLNLDEQVNNVKIIIHSDIPINNNNSKVWLFGNNGNINFENDSIVINSNGILSTDQYIVLLTKFESNLYNTNNKSSFSFDQIYNSAVENKKVEKPMNRILTIIIIAILFPILFLLLIIYSIFNSNKSDDISGNSFTSGGSSAGGSSGGGFR